MATTKDRATSDPGGARNRASSGSRTRSVDFVLLWFTDIVGQLKSFAITIDELEGALDDGMGFDGSSITGFNPIEESDMVAIPDPTTFQVLPWQNGRAQGRAHDLRRRDARTARRTRATRATS